MGYFRLTVYGVELKKIAVIGAGVTGITTAYQLLKKGFEVYVFEKERYVAMETSYANGGQISACNSEVWTSWKTVFQGVKWIFKKDAPLLFNLKPSIHKLGWILDFLSNISNYKKNTVLTAKMAIESRKELIRILEEENLKIDLERRGIINLSNSKKNFEHGLIISKWLKEAGLNRETLNKNDIKKIEPTIDVDRFYGGFYTESDMSGDIHLFTKQLANKCKEKGTTFYFSTKVVQVVNENKKIKINFINEKKHMTEIFDAVVICAGVNSKAFSYALGDNINIYPVKGYSITIMLNDNLSQNAAPKVSLLDDGAKIVSSRLGKNRFRIAGTAEFNGYNRDIRSDRIEPLLKWCNNIFPEVSTENSVPWAGLRPMTPSMMPRIGSGLSSGVFYNTGHGHLGWTLSPISSKMIVEEILRSENF